MPNRHSTLNSLFTDIANAIRTKKGEASSVKYVADNFDTAIEALNTVNTVSSVPSTKSSDIIYNTSDSSYYLWEN